MERGPPVHGSADQRWTLARIKTLIGRLFHVSYTVEGTWQLLKSHAWSWQQPCPPGEKWRRRGRTPVVRVRGRGAGRVPMAGQTFLKSRKRSRIFYSVREYRDRKGEPKGIGRRDLRDLLVRVHIQLGGPTVVVWDNCETCGVPLGAQACPVGQLAAVPC
ncbi:winged helix-turn-helix domain-containing protein [Streptomyces vinaceus]|uniref:winged helix-turn-helix domain-containing protein n=1 Tax=Streptomyces vinaceus TaxID=1960 RepID=UPI0035DCF798